MSHFRCFTLHHTHLSEGAENVDYCRSMTDVAAPTSRKTDRDRAFFPLPNLSLVWLPTQKENSAPSTTTTPPPLLLSLIDFFSSKSVCLCRPLSLDDLCTGRLHSGTRRQTLQQNPTETHAHAPVHTHTKYWSQGPPAQRPTAWKTVICFSDGEQT